MPCNLGWEFHPLPRVGMVGSEPGIEEGEAVSVVDKILPRQASNDYRGSPIALYVFVLLSLVMAGRSLIHFLKDDSGVNSIATIHMFPGDPDPNTVIYMFSALWGSQQVIMVLLYGVVLFRYRNLIPLMYVVFLVETAFRAIVATLHPLTAEHYLRTPPGAYANLPMLVISVAMLVLALRTRSTPGAAPETVD